MTEAEEAQYNAMVEALALEQDKNAKLKERINKLEIALDKICELAEDIY